MPAPAAANTKKLDEIRREEVVEVIERRRAVGLTPKEGAETEFQAEGRVPKTASSLTGLALSGGGIRSCSFNLGLLQALHDRGLLRFIDYMSTVSGGGYVGSLLTSALSDRKATMQNDKCPLKGCKDGQQQRIRRFIASGTYLLNLVRFSNRYLIGTLLNNVTIFSALVFASALIAGLWRTLDCDWSRDRLSAIGFDSDIYPALLPGCLLGLSWVAAWLISYWKSGARASGGVAKVLLVLTFFAFLTGLAILIGNGDVTVGAHDSTLLKSLRWPLALATGAGLIPFLAPRIVLRSGVNPKNYLESWIFYYASAALLLGVPLLLIGLLGRENVSGFGTQRGPEFLNGDLKDPERFAFWVQSQGSWLDDLNGDGKPEPIALWAKPDLKTPIRAPSRNGNDGANPKAQETERDSRWNVLRPLAKQLLEDYKAERDARKRLLGPEKWTPAAGNWLWWKYGDPFRRIVYLVVHLLPVTDARDDYAELVASQKKARRATDELLRAFNELVLTDASLPNHQAFLRRPTAGVATSEKPNATGATGSDDHGASPVPSLISAVGTPDDDEHILDQFLRWRDRLGMGAFDEPEISEFNRRLLVSYFPDFFRSRTQIRRVTVIGKDQWARFFWAVCALVVFGVSAFLVRPNCTSLQGYYRNQLSSTYLEVPAGREELLLREIDAHTRGAPYHLLCATANALDWRQPCVPMESLLFSPRYCGTATLGYQRTEEYAGGRMDLATAVAVSGAAVSPSYFRNWLVRSLLLVLNLRLGQWLPNPGTKTPQSEPSILGLLLGLRRPAAARPYVFVTDGGHLENLGIGELLARRCSLIIVSDAGQDPKFEYGDFARVVQAMRIRHGVEFLEWGSEKTLCVKDRLPLETKHDKDKETRPSDQEGAEPRPRHFFCARIRYPAPRNQEPDPNLPVVREGLLVYLKPSLNGDEDVDIQYYKARCPGFPHETTADQAFEPEQIEAYRQLGFHVGMDLCRDMTDALRSADAVDIACLFAVFVEKKPASPAAPQTATIEELVEAKVTKTPPQNHGNGEGPTAIEEGASNPNKPK